MATANAVRLLPLDGGGQVGVAHALPPREAPHPNPPRKGEGVGLVPGMTNEHRWRGWF